MTASRVRLVSVVWLLALLVIVLATWAGMTDPRAGTTWEEVVRVIAFGFGFTTVGAILVTRRPREPVGRIALLIGLVAIAATGLRSVAIVLDWAPGPIPSAGAIAAVVSSQPWNAVLMSASLLLVRFPAGLERDRLSTIANGLFLLALGCTLIVTFAPSVIQVDWIEQTHNPLGVAALDRGTAETIASAGLFLYVAGLAVTALVFTRRYRRSGPVVRAQIRWVAAAGALPVVLFPGLFIGTPFLWTAWFLSFALLPIAIGIAILRYRLYDIDRIISRTLSWAAVTGVLVAVFAGAVIALQTVLAPVTDNSTIAVAASTLLAFALFQPIRRGVQRAVDRRFNRARYDAQRIADAFAGAIRSQLDLVQLRGAPVDTATLSVQPHGAAVWLRAGGRR